jgi:hypothetical protein
MGVSIFLKAEDSWPTSITCISKVELTFRELNIIRSVQAIA